MDKVEGRYLIGLGHEKKIMGKNSFIVDTKTYEFVNTLSVYQGLMFAKNVALLSNRPNVKFTDCNGIHEIPIATFDKLLGTMILSGNIVWEEKLRRYQLLDNANSSEDIESIVNMSWDFI